MAVDVVDAPESGRYEARVDGAEEIAGIAQYLRTPEPIVFVHTEVEPAHEGRGVGGALARASLDAARAEGLRVLAVRPFYAGRLRRRPEYADLLYQSRSSVADRGGAGPVGERTPQEREHRGERAQPVEKEYRVEQVDVTFRPGRCPHAAECVRGLPEVFDLRKRPWVTPDAAAPSRSPR